MNKKEYYLFIKRVMKVRVTLYMHKMVIAGLGGATGALLRYGVSILFPSSNNSIPYGTLFINGLGSFILACLTYSIFMNGKHERLKVFFGTGLCGGFTTMSAFALEVTNLVMYQPAYGFIYLMLNMVIGILMAWLGFFAGSRVGRSF